VYRQPDLVDFGDRHGDWEVVGESVLIDRLDPSAHPDWLRIDTWIDRGRQFEDLQSRWVDPDRGVTGRHVLVDQELVQHLGLVVEGSYAIQANPSERYNDYWNLLSVPCRTYSAILEWAR
jgi:hypothetical protein